MNKTKIMGIGIGRAGNVLLNEFLKKDKRYKGLFVNTAISDTRGLEKFDINKNAYIFSATSGSGKDRDFAKEMLKDDIQGLADSVARYPIQDTVIIFFSLDGGTGSGITPIFTKMLKLTCPNKKINLIGVIPDFDKADKLSLKNTMACWNEITELSDTTVKVKQSNGSSAELDIINDIKYIDNSKRETYKAVNIKAINDLDCAFTMTGECEYGSIDDNDAKRFNTAKGYGLILELDKKYHKIKDAIDNALADTVFAIPNQYICNYMGISLKDFDILEAKEQFDYTAAVYVAKNSTHNTMVLGGCDEPSEIIETIKEAYDMVDEKIKGRNKTKGTIIDLKSTTKNIADTSELKTSFTSEELDDIMKDLF